jgi:hypothetical protein
MPYITEERREFFDTYIPWGIFNENSLPGELNYIITTICLEYLNGKKKSYKTYNDIIGAIENCKLEFYRREISNYENKKIQESGDVY